MNDNTPNILDSLYKEHKEKFDKEPYIIGLNWHDQEVTIKGIIKALDVDDKPYDERDSLTPEELEAFNAGCLIF